MSHMSKSRAGILDAARRMKLDTVLLDKAFQVQTNWHVLTGAICCGKTTLINALADRGYRTLPEVSRIYLECEVAKGRKLEDIFASTADERALTKLQRLAEYGLEAQETVFLDRALPDYLWFWRLLGMDPNELLEHCFHFRYASVFILDQLPLEMNGARIDDMAYTDLLEEYLTRDYMALGYAIVRVPLLSPNERTEFILDQLGRQGLLLEPHRTAETVPE